MATFDGYIAKLAHLTAYDFSIGRSNGRPLEYLDGYSGYDELFKKEGSSK